MHAHTFSSDVNLARKGISTIVREPITAPTRLASRDTKLMNREMAWAETHNFYLVKCKCNIFVGTPTSKLSPLMARTHLQDFGRHPYFRGRTQIKSPLDLFDICLLCNFFCKIRSNCLYPNRKL
ncbi:hypothetical protein M758_UG160100 [Ceratodon purpureus]|nr:hypothetical protein M758_UG160100 [Ceratodon purpureus]